MNFKQATDKLFKDIGHAELAEALGVSVASIRQARLKPDAQAHRAAPPNWEKAVIRIAKMRINKLEQLVSKLRAGTDGS